MFNFVKVKTVDGAVANLTQRREIEVEINGTVDEIDRADRVSAKIADLIS